MTSTVSNKKISPFMHNMLCGIKSKRKLIIIISILHFVAAPLTIISLIISIYCKVPGDAISEFLGEGVVTTAIAGFIGIFIAIDSFSCLHKRSVVDMRLSLPLTANQRFFSNFLSGLAVYMGPFLAAQVISLLGMAYGFMFMEGRTFLTPSFYSNGEVVRYREYVCDYFSQAMPILLKLIFCGILVMLMLYTLTVLVTVCCGSKFESIAYTLLINVIIPLTIYIVFISMFDDLYGVSNAITSLILKLIMCTSPAGGIMATVDWCAGSSGYFRDNPAMDFAIWAVIYVLFIAAIGAAAFFLYRKRRAEQVSKPFVFKLIYYIISSAVLFCAYSICSINHTKLVPTITITIIVYLTFEVAANRGFRKIWLSFIKYAGVMLASFLMIFSAQKTEGFGMVTRVPTLSSVSYAEIDYGGFYGLFPPYEMDNFYTTGNSALTFSEKENIQTIIDAHQSRVDTREDKYSWGAGLRSITIIYHLKNGSRLERSYNNFDSRQAEILSKLDLTDEYKTQGAEMYKKLILKSKEEYLKVIEWNSREQDYHDTFVNTLGSLLESRAGRDDSRIKTSILAESNFYEDLAEAYAADIMNISEENYYHSEARNPRYLSLATAFDIAIPDTFENTLAVLKKYGFTVFDKAELSDLEAYNFLNSINNDGKRQEIQIYNAKEWRVINQVPNDLTLHANYCYNDTWAECYVTEIDNDLCDIFRASEIMNIVPDNGYIICVFGYPAVVPQELNGAAKRVYAGRTTDDRIEYDTL